MSHGRTHDEQRFSPLRAIDTATVSRLGLAWHADFDTNRGQEATPLYIDGVLYVSTAWSKVYAFDARTGQTLWKFDPQVPGGTRACCDVVNRGVAAWKGRIYIGTLDGRLIALDAASGREAWSVQTILAVAAKTWNGEWWIAGGGGTAWDAIVYDPVTDLLYLGVGNGSPWNAALRSPGGGDNLFLSSIVAVRPDTGEYAWHFQTTPGETWDYTATQPMMLADLELDGRKRRVLMQAPKNGFFYVLDAASGEFLSGQAFVPVNWAEGLDAKGRPIEVEAARFDRTGQGAIVIPGGGGAHSWHPWSGPSIRPPGSRPLP